jgi:hypothetical protein
MLKNILIINLLFVTIIIFQSCANENSLLISDEELVVLWGFVFAGEQVDDIQLTGTLTLDADSSEVPPPINDANVTIFKDDIAYECKPSPGDSGYYHYNGDDLTIETDDEISIEVIWNGQEIYAKSTVPEAPINVNISNDTYTIPDFSDRGEIREWRESGNQEVEITWEIDNEEDWFYVSMENIEENPVAIESIFGNRVKTFVFPPIQDSIYRIRLPIIEHLGLHEIKVYKVNQEYVDLYESRNQDSRDLNEPLTNVQRGLGIFSAFNFQVVYLNIIQESDSGVIEL